MRRQDAQQVAADCRDTARSNRRSPAGMLPPACRPNHPTNEGLYKFGARCRVIQGRCGLILAARYAAGSPGRRR